MKWLSLFSLDVFNLLRISCTKTGCWLGEHTCMLKSVLYTFVYIGGESFIVEIDWTTEGHVMMYGVAFSPLLFPCGYTVI